MRQLLSPRQLALLAPAAVLVLGVAVAALLEWWWVALVLLALLQAAVLAATLVLRNGLAAAARQRRRTERTLLTAVKDAEDRLAARADAHARSTRSALDAVERRVAADERQEVVQSVIDLLGADRLDAVERHEELRAQLRRLESGGGS